METKIEIMLTQDRRFIVRVSGPESSNTPMMIGLMDMAKQQVFAASQQAAAKKAATGIELAKESQIPPVSAGRNGKG